MASKQQIPTLAGVIVSNQGAFEALPTDDAQWVIENPEAAIALWIFATKNRNQNPPPIMLPIQKRKLSPNVTISYGGLKIGNLLEKVVGSAINIITDRALDLINKPAFTIQDTESSADLIFLSPKDLGFITNPRTEEFMTAEFCAEWSSKYLDGQVIELCVPELGPHLRAQYTGRTSETRRVAMERIIGTGGNPYVFELWKPRTGCNELDAAVVSELTAWNLNDPIVFRLRKASA